MRRPSEHIDSGLAGVLCVSALLAAALLGAGCDNTVDPLANEDGDVFAIHGFLETSADTQFVRVEPLRSAILANETSLEDVSVTSRDVGTGETVEWRDSTITLNDGSTGTLYFGIFAPLEGHVYELNIRRSDRPGSRATTRIPDRPGIIVGRAFDLRQRVQVLDVPRRPERLMMRYEVVVPGESASRTIDIIYGDVDENRSNKSVTVNLATDKRIILSRLNRTDEDQPLTLKQLGLVVELPSAEWENMSLDRNLDNAEGFFGSIAVFHFNWMLPQTVVNGLGYIDGQP